MLEQIKKYSEKLVLDRSASKDRIAFAAQDDVLVATGNPELTKIASVVLPQLNCLALLVATPALPFAEFLLQKTPFLQHEIVPRDTETRTFLHDVPVLRRDRTGNISTDAIVHLLGNRKGIIVEGIGIIATGALTIEQAYINWSSVFHSAFIKYLEDVLQNGLELPGEEQEFTRFRNDWLIPLTSNGLVFITGPLNEKEEILEEMANTGRYTVQRGLVDSFFGNISYLSGDLIYISQTASSLDELPGCIDPVPFENRSTVGITASSELAAHRSIFQSSDCRAILHGHPRFSVIMSMLCEDQENCNITDCWRDCKKVRKLGSTPVIAGEIGAGGLAKNLSPVISETGCAIVYGHGVFSIGKYDFAEAFQRLVDVENWCREEYFRRFDERYNNN